MTGLTVSDTFPSFTATRNATSVPSALYFSTCALTSAATRSNASGASPASLRAADGGRVQELYERLAAARKETGEAPLAFDRVAALVKAQVAKYSADGTEVAFRVAMKDGKVSLTVKPVKGE